MSTDLAVALASGQTLSKSPRVTVSIPSYELQSGWGGSVALYKVITTDDASGLTTTVLKRFNTFYDLRAALEEKYASKKDLLPALPLKKWKLLIDHTNSNFLTDRRYALQDFIRRLSENPVFGDDILFQNFIRPQTK
tara:strand:- start:724 stop:1134 length:411 start_codon:yes stop_codon:yes gene_type:complete